MQTLPDNYQVENQMTIFDFIPDSGFGKTYQEPCPQTTEKTSEASLKKLRKSKSLKFLYLNLSSGVMQGMWTETDGALLGVSETQLAKECHREEEESFLWRILEENAPEKYYLSEKACLGILRRCAKRGKELPSVLMNALKSQANISEEKLQSLLAES